MSYDVFISYASADREVAAQLRRLLEEQGLSVWQDTEELRGGSPHSGPP
jgi:TIR domain